MNSYIYNLGLLFNKLASGNESIALRFIDETTITYNVLEVYSNKIANYLLDMGITQNNVVAIFNNKSLESYSIMIACLKIGAIYTNIDHNSPVERLNKMIQQCNPTIFFTFTDNINRLTDTNISKVHVCDYACANFKKELDTYSSIIPENVYNVTGDTPAYLMFTSGSTGFPKGVVITHSNVLNLIEWSKYTYSSSKQDIFTNINPMHFDNSVFDFYSSLFTGASLIPIPEDLTKNPRLLIKELNKAKPTIWFSVPSMLVFALKLRAITTDDLLTLRIVTFGGEGFPKNQLRNLWKFWGDRVQFINVYGPTECTCICSSYLVSAEDVESDELLPLGPIAPNFCHLIINESGNVVEDESIGELCIVGPNVGLGYYNNLDKTNEVFVQHPAVTAYKQIMYKSGDLVRYDKNKGILHFCGRKDNQIKRMGYRIELEEIENAFSALSYVEENAVIYIKTNDDNGKIIACLRSRKDDDSLILNDLSKFIPSYMLPNEIKYYDHLPKNQNGKIDRITLKNECV